MHKKDKIYVPPAEPLTSEYVSEVVWLHNRSFGDPNRIALRKDRRVRWYSTHNGDCYDSTSTEKSDFDIIEPSTLSIDATEDQLKALYNEYDVKTGKKKEPTFTGSYAERQAQWVKHHGIKVGSKVKVVRKAKSKEDGHGLIWSSTKNHYVGSEVTVTHIRDYNNEYSSITAEGYDWPYFVLEPVK